MKRSYWVRHGDFGNVYSLRWSYGFVDDNDFVKISFRDAVRLCVQERRRRKNDESFSGYADTYIYPFGVDHESDLYYDDKNPYILVKHGRKENRAY